MKSFAGLVFLVLSIAAANGEDAIFKRAFPNPIPTDADFDTVVSSQPEYAKLKYPVPIIGWAYHPEEIHVTPEGALVFPDPRNPSLYVAPLISTGADAPHVLSPDEVKKSLVDGYKPGVQSEWNDHGLKIEELAFGSLLKGEEVVTGREILLGMVRYTLSNPSSQAISGEFLLDFGKGGFNQLHKLVPPPYEGRLAVDNRLLMESNGWLAASILSCSLGQPTLDTNTLRIAFHLSPKETKALEMAVPYFPLFPERATQLLAVDFQSHFKAFKAYWEKELNQGAQFILPEKRLRDAYRAWIAYNLILPDRDPTTGLLLIHPDATYYEAVWGGDASVVMQSMDRMGYHKFVEDCTRYFFSRQGMRKPDADVETYDGFFCGDAVRWLSENGFILWALCEHYKLTGDKDWLRAAAPRLLQSANWIIHERERTKVLQDGKKPRHWGLMIQGRPSDLGDWDYWYFNDTYSYMGIKDVSEVLGDAGYGKDAARIGKAAADYKACILDSVRRSVNTNVQPPFVPLTPYKNDKPTEEYLYRYWYHLNPPIYMVEAGIFGPNDDLATWSDYWVEKYGMVSGLCKFQPETIDPHYTYHEALAELLRGETDKFVWTLYSLYAYGQSRDTYATIEWSNLRTGIKERETWDDCRQPHMHSNSRCLALLRIALVLEQESKLHLMMGTPRGWLADGKELKILNAPTSFGNVSYSAESKIADGRISVEITPPSRRTADIVLHLRPPSKYGSIESVSVNGRRWDNFSGDAIDLGTTTNQLAVVCRFR
ncbi:MAG TPA: hypothetical protein VH595_23160 [Verrucomicrobiae bacterium]|jgi:hypothetical protein|nr:hypothetical protein [Verrucomicrobiae bacterium]